MLKNEETRQTHPFYRKGLNDLNLNELRVAAFAQFARNSDEIIVALWMYQKLISHSVTR